MATKVDNMNDEEAKNLVDNIFSKIESANSFEELEQIEIDESIAKFKMDLEKYPPLKLVINEKDIDKLIETGIIDKSSLSFIDDVDSKIEDPLAKLLYAILWKQGDLLKISHVLKGIRRNGNDSKSGVVFHQFGRHLSNPENEPIIDQHVIRAFAIRQESEKIKYWRKLGLITNKEAHITIVDEYCAWLKNSKGWSKKEIDIVDKILFATGKAVKAGKRKNEDETA